MTQATVTETHERRITRLIRRDELRAILTAFVAKEVGIPDGTQVKAVVDVTDETEGSPAYRVGSKAMVTLTIDLTPKAEAHS